MEVHSCNLHICLDIDKRALFCAKFAMRYLFRKKGNIILQHFNMNEGLSHIFTQHIREKLPTVELLVMFKHPNPSEKRIVCKVLIKGIIECLKICFMEIHTTATSSRRAPRELPKSSQRAPRELPKSSYLQALVKYVS